MTPPNAIRGAVVLVAALALFFAPAVAQTNGARPNIFFDCDGRNCNNDYFRTEVAWVNWVRDRAVSDVHVIMTSESTGSGGRSYLLDFIGVTSAGYSDQMVFTSASTETEREQLDGITHALGLGLARFAAVAGYRGLVTVQGHDIEETRASSRVVGAAEVDDPWNLWSFQVGGSANVDGESTRETRRFNGNLSANRVTPTWKLNFNGRTNYQRQEFERSDSTLFVDQRTDWNLDQTVVYSLGQSWSIGYRSRSGRLTRFNQDFRVSLTPAIEYSFFPYEEATRRALTAYYEIGPTYRNYIEETIFGELAEVRWGESLQLQFSQRQPWGDASVSGEFSHFMHDITQRNVSFRGDVDFRITRGLSINAGANVSWVNDQIYLSAEDESDEEILLRLQQRQTDFNYGFDVGFSFRFGSIYNNVVNNRFRRNFGGGRGGGGN